MPRSPRRDRKRSRSRSHSRERTRRRRSRSKSRSPRHRRRSSSHDSPRRDGVRKDKNKEKERPEFVKRDVGEDEEMIFTKVPETDPNETEGKDEDEVEMLKLMGFANFDTTKDKQVIGNDLYCANIVRKRRYRQYMNRKGGFNRPLDAIA